MEEGWAKNGPVRLHYIDNKGDASSIPLVMVPGFASIAEDFAEVAKSFLPRRCVSLSLRGRGKSDTPSLRYSLDDHAEDIASVVKGLGFEEVCVMAHSRGVSYAIRFATAHREFVRGLILLDYPPRHSKPSPEWAESFLASDFGKAAMPYRLRPETVRGVQRDSGGEVLLAALEELDVPVLVIRGGRKGSLLKDEDAATYEKHLKDVRVVIFEESEHDQWKPDLARFVRTVSEFLTSIDGREA